ncbi:MAG TPA: S8 family serine peptidase [Trebonia sp.]
MSTAACSALALGAVPAIAGPAQAASTAGSGPAAKAGGGSQKVIIFLRNQLASAGSGIGSGQRLAQLQAAQAPYVGQLQQLGATDVHGYRLADAISAKVPASALGPLSASPGVASVIPDSPIQGPAPAGPTAVRQAKAPVKKPKAPVKKPGAPVAKPKTSLQKAKASAKKTPAKKARPATAPIPPGACSATPQLAPEALALTHTDSPAKSAPTARSLGYTGTGVKVAFLADGIDTANANLTRGGKPVITDYKDFSGDGTTAATAGGEAFMDASSIAGQGSQVYNVSGFGAQVPAAACKIKIEGVAPGAALVALKVFSQSNVSTTSGFLQAIDYAVNTEHVNVLNESFGSNPFPDVTSLDAVKAFNDMAVAAGVTVVVASGDAGPFNTIGSPATDPDVISVGASTDYRFYSQTNYADADQFAPGGWESGNISSLSSGGYTEDGRTLDLVAPGDMSFAACSASSRYSSCVNFLGKSSPVEESGGTSAAAPLVSGAAALVIQAYAKAHHGMVPSPAAVKQILLSSAADLGAPATEQGSGLLNSFKAVELAASVYGGSPAGPALQLSANQLNFTSQTGAPASWAVTVTNPSKTAQQVAVSGRAFGAGSTVKKAVVKLSDTASRHFTSWAGAAANYGTVQFTVPKGQALLNASIAWGATSTQAGSLNARVRVILVNPSGKLAGDSLPQGVGGYGSAQVLRPAAGTWTAVISSNTTKAGGTAGAVQFGATVAQATTFGTMSPSTLSLAPGASGVVHVSARVPSGAGDSSGSLVLSSAGRAVSVPVTLRGEIPTGLGAAGGKFSGVLTGGNGRSPGEGQVASYTFVVPSSLPVLLRNIDVDVALANDPANQVSAYLVSPSGETMGYGSSDLTTGFTTSGVPVESPQNKLSLYTSNPIPGVWRLIVDFTSPVPGNELADPFTGKIRLNAVSFSRGALPDSPSVTLTRGKAVTYQISVHNTGAAPENIFLDARLTATGSYALQPQNQAANVKLPLPASANPPEWIVPTMTHSVSATATSSTTSAPVMFDFGPFPGDPDMASSSGATAKATYPLGPVTTPVTQGLWFDVPAETGPFGPGGATGASVTSSMTAVTQLFDTSASSSTGDFWQFGVKSLAASATYNLFVVNPGQTRTISLTLKPTAAKGTAVRGMLYIDDFADSLQFLSGSQLVALPYSYKVG